jgi:prepilin peptidase CpaA
MNPMFVLALFASGSGAVVDYRTGHIPNAITASAFAAGISGNVALAAMHGGASAVPGAIGTALGGAALASIVPLVLYRGRALGGGDVKLFAALGAILGPLVGLEAQLYTFAAAALLFPIRLAWQGKLGATLLRSLALVVGRFVPSIAKRAEKAEPLAWVRLGPAIFAGTILALFVGLR